MPHQLWYITKYFVPDDEVSAGTRGWQLVKELDKKKYQTTVFTSNANMFLHRELGDGASHEEVKDGVRIVFLRTLKYQTARSFRRILGWLHFEYKLFFIPKRSYPRPDIILVSSLSIFTIINGLYFKWRYKCPLLFEIRDIWPLTLIEEGGFSRFHPIILAIAWLERLGYLGSDKIIGTMPNLTEHVTKVTGKNLPVACLPMGVSDLQIIERRPIEQDFKDKYFSSEKMSVVYAGTIGITNALDTFFDAAKRCSQIEDIEFIVVGEGDLKEKYMKLTSDWRNIRFAPHVPKNQVQAVLENADVLYFSTFCSEVWRYGQSLNKLIDYMLSGKPIIGSYSGYPSMINEANCGLFVEAENPQALFEALVFMLEMPIAERIKMGQRGSEWILENRRYSKLAESFSDMLDEATDKYESP
ncbi:MAG: glycosyltransferase family 4 protein [Alphaproteobacteria bacterium]|nr:glycosyltransferase family 4 protein [Alphaproteobacteria bacterium]